MIVLEKDFTEEQKELAKELLDQLEVCHEIRKYCYPSVYGLIYEKDKNGDEVTNILFKFEYFKDEIGYTIFSY